MKVVLAALNAKYVHSNLAVYDLQAYARAHGDVDVELVVREYTINHNLDAILRKLYMEHADVIAFSCYIWNIREIRVLAAELSKISPNTRLWVGGPEVSYHSDMFLQENPAIEGVMRGEGEATFLELLSCWSETFSKRGDLSIQKKDYEKVGGITYRSATGAICENPARPLISLDDIPFFYTDFAPFQNRILYYETSRGCPFSCSYCLSSVDKTVRFRSLSLVEAELQAFLDEQVRQVKLIDRTFNCNRNHALAIWRYLKEHDNGVTNFHFEVAADLIGEEELSLFSSMRPGLIQLEIGLQSTNPVTIREIRRRMDVERVRRNLLTIGGFQNIHQHLDLIVGLPYEDVVSFRQSFLHAYEMKPAQLQLGFLKVLKGSYIEEKKEEYGLVYQAEQPYEVLCTKWISYEEVIGLKKVEEMVEVYYNSGQFIYSIAYLVCCFSSPFELYKALGNYCEREGLLEIGIRREQRYEILRDFYVERFGKCDRIMDELLTFDYYLRENGKTRPAWAKSKPFDKTVYQEFFKKRGTEEYAFEEEGYDSKMAARAMHIEPISARTLLFIEKEDDNAFYDKRVLTKVKEETCYCLFDYEKRNPLSHNASVYLLSHL